MDDERKFIGLVLVILPISLAATVLYLQFFVYPNFSFANQYISALGVGHTGIIFNSAIILFGIIAILIGISLYDVHGLLIGISGIGAIGLGIFNINFGEIHILFAGITFLGVIALALYHTQEFRPSIIFFLVGLFAVVLYLGKTSLGLGNGTIEEILFYSDLTFLAVFGVEIFLSS